MVVTIPDRVLTLIDNYGQPVRIGHNTHVRVGFSDGTHRELKVDGLPHMVRETLLKDLKFDPITRSMSDSSEMQSYDQAVAAP